MADSMNPLQDLYNFNKQRETMLQEAQNKPQSALGNVDPVMLAIAGGMFAPTKTGGFGESISNAANAAAGPLRAIRDQQTAAQDKQAQIKEATARLWLMQQKQDRDAENGPDSADLARYTIAQKTYREMYGLDNPLLIDPRTGQPKPGREDEYAKRQEQYNTAMKRYEDMLAQKGAGRGAGVGAGVGGSGNSGGGGGPISLESIPKEGFIYIPRSQRDYEALPPNSQYKDPSGTVRTKPDRSNNPPA
jgi:hypothetical protein